LRPQGPDEPPLEELPLEELPLEELPLEDVPCEGLPFAPLLVPFAAERPELPFALSNGPAALGGSQALAPETPMGPLPAEHASASIPTERSTVGYVMKRAER
jgi:hypothetical protein